MGISVHKLKAYGPSALKLSDRPVERLRSPTFVLTCGTTFFNYLSYQLLLPVIPLYLLHIGGADWQVGLVLGVTAFTALLARPFVGYVADQVGRRPLLVGGPICYIGTALLHIVARSVPALLAVRVVSGVGISANSTGSPTYASDVAPASRRGEAIGIIGSAMNLAIAFGPLIGIWLLAEYGYNTVFLVAALAGLVALLIALPLPEIVKPASKTDGPAPRLIDRFLSGDMLLPMAIGLCSAATWGAILSYLPILAEKESLGNVGFFFMPYAATILLVRVVGGRASDRYGRRAVLLPGMVAVAAAWP